MLARPATELPHLLPLDLRRRSDRARATEEIRRGHLTWAVHEGVEETQLDDRLNLGAREAIRASSQLLQVEGEWVSTSLAQMDLEDLRAVFHGGQVDEDDLPEPSLPDLLRRELPNVVRRADDEHVLLLLHPVEEVGDRPCRLAAIAPVRRLEPADRLLELRDAQDPFERSGNCERPFDAHRRRADHAAALAHD